MDKKLFEKAQHIISPYLNKETRVMDLYCGEDCYTKWIKRENNALLVPLSPKDMEHISHENPFVAYNNFINDNRKIPTKQGKADVVLLLGPLYDKQSEEKKRETLKEVKSLISPDGKVITLRSCEANKPNSSNSFEDEEQNFYDAGFDVKEQQRITKIAENTENTEDTKNEVSSKNESSQTEESNYLGWEYYLTVATPKPVISCDALPPEVFVRTPVEIIQKYNITVLDDRKTSQEDEKDSKDGSDIKDSNDNKKTEDIKENNNSRCNNEVKPSINPSLQRKSVVKNSIDNTLYVTKKQEENKVVSYDLPILPKEITEQYNNSGKENNADKINDDLLANNSNKEINTKDNQNNNSNNELSSKVDKGNISKKEISNKLVDIDNSKKEVIEKNLWDIPPLPHIPIKPSIDKNLYVRKKNNDSSVRNNEKIDCKKVQQSIDKSLQIRIPKINPKYAKPKSKKKCIRNVLR